VFRFHVVQAEYGDALLLEYGTANSPRFILIDGGPPGTYDNHLRSVLADVRRIAPKLELAVLSHVDNDHVTGLLDYFAELQAQPADLPRPDALWHNAFADAIDPDGTIRPRLAALLTATRSAAMPATALAVNGISEGRTLRVRAAAARVPVNPTVPTGLVTVDTLVDEVRFGNLSLRVVGPTKANLAKLQKQWKDWLKKHEDELDQDAPMVLANSDQSVPNLSSIMLFARADERTILLTGDGRSDHLLEGLEAAGLLDHKGNLHVDVLKLAHHGSERDVTKKFFSQVTADTYVASANGRDGNPDINTLLWIVEAAKAEGRRFTLVVTNRTPSVAQLVKRHPPETSSYTLTILPATRHAQVLELSA
jgi:hypothetical protein